MISEYKAKIRQRVAIVKSSRIGGSTSTEMREILFNAYVLPLFTWLCPIFPLLTDCQREDLSHFCMTCQERVTGVPYWNDFTFASLFKKVSFEYRCASYWRRYKRALLKSTDGFLLFEQQALNFFRTQWLDKELVVKHMHRSKRSVQHTSVITTCLGWLESHKDCHPPSVTDDELERLTLFPISFL
jgi:hypothetical protein